MQFRAGHLAVYDDYIAQSTTPSLRHTKSLRMRITEVRSAIFVIIDRPSVSLPPFPDPDTAVCSSVRRGKTQLQSCRPTGCPPLSSTMGRGACCERGSGCVCRGAVALVHPLPLSGFVGLTCRGTGLGTGALRFSVESTQRFGYGFPTCPSLFQMKQSMVLLLDSGSCVPH